MFIRYILTVAISLLMVAIATFADEQGSKAGREKRAWEWSDQERIASRMDDVAAAARLRTHRASTTRGELVSATEPYDVIVGRRDAHLFLGAEVFDHLLSLAYADDARTREAYRESKDDQRSAVGLPSDLWDQLAVITAAYRADRLQERSIATAANRSTSKRGVKGLETLLCRDRAAALHEAETIFGPAFTRFLYEAVAPNMVEFVLRKPDTTFVRGATGECQ